MNYFVVFIIVAASIKISYGNVNVFIAQDRTKEGTSIGFTIESNVTDACTLFTSDASQGTFSPSPAHLMPNVKRTIFFNAIEDFLVDGDQVVLFGIQCIKFSQNQIAIPFIALDSRRINGINGDPHFIQTVSDVKTGENQKVCYDVTGKAGNYIEIFKHKKFGTSVQGQLLDDYYMHKIVITSRVCNITVTNKGISLDSKSILEWNERNQMRIYRNKKCSVFVKENIIDVFGHEKYFDGISFHIERAHNSVTGYYFNVDVNGIVSYEGIEGLIGKVGNSKFMFYNSVQDDKTTKGAVAINGHFTTAKKEQRYGLSCWLMDVKDVIHPQPISNFVLQETKEDIY